MISVVIPLYNRESLVAETLDSILAQTYGDWECVVVDDGSTDRSVSVVEEYTKKDPRIRLHIRPQQSVKGAPTCRNIGFERSSGEYVYFFDSDDILSPMFFEAITQSLSREVDAEYATFQIDNFIDSVDRPVRATREFRRENGTLLEQIIGNRIQSLTQNFIWKRSLIDRMPMKWREGLKCSQDPDFAARALCHAASGVWLDIPCLVHVRKHHDSIGSTSRLNYNIRARVFKGIFEYCRQQGKVTPRFHGIFMRYLLRMQVVVAILHGRSALSKEYGDVLCETADRSFSGMTFRVFSLMLNVATPLIYYGGVLCERLHLPIVAEKLKIKKQMFAFE